MKHHHLKRLGLAIFAALLPTFAIWTPFFLRLGKFWTIPLPTDGMATVVANYDGPLYIVVAKTLYNANQITTNFSFPLPTQYYAAHFPLFPLLIKGFSLLLGYPYAMLLVTLLSSIFCFYYFQIFISEFVKKKDIVWLTLVFAIFPARWLIVRSVGSPETLFLGLTIASMHHFIKKEYLKAGVFGALAQLTKSPGIILFLAYAAYLIIPKLHLLATTKIDGLVKKLELVKTLPLLLIPLSLIGLFIFYGSRFGDFFAYFNSGDNIHLFFPPFQIFNYSAPWVGTFWLEEIIYIYAIGAIGVIKLFQSKHMELAWYSLLFFVSLIFVSHRDISRYALPLIPFLYVAYKEMLSKKEFKYVMAIIAIPIFLFSLAYISQNVMPISDWAPLL